MKTLSINTNNDIYLDSSGSLAFAQGINAQAAIATNKTRTLYGEVPLAAQAGIPFFDVVFNKFDPKLFEQFLRQTLLETPGAVKVSQYEYGVKNGTLTYSAVLTTNHGEVTING